MNKKWFKLDTAGLIFPATKTTDWINVYRISVTLKEEIDPILLQKAVNDLKNRFPSFYVALKSGFFWNHLIEIKSPLLVKKDYAYPLTHMTTKEIHTCCMRIFYHQNRIAVEIFHSITDGTGASIYVRSLIAQYIKLKYQQNIEYNDVVLDPSKNVENSELEDSFFRYSNGYGNSRNEKIAYRLHGIPEFSNGFLTLTTGVIDTDILHQTAKRYHCTITILLSALMIQAIVSMQNQEKSKKHQKNVAISIAVNLRKIFPSNTLRNFVLSENIGIDPNQGEYSLEELCDILSKQLSLKLTKQNMASEIAANVLPQQNVFVRLVPLPIKQVIMDMVYSAHGEKHSCINISNLGQLKLPEEIEKYVDRAEFIIGVQRSYPNNCSVVSVGNTTCINMIRSIKESELERRFFSSLVELGIPVLIESNRRK